MLLNSPMMIKLSIAMFALLTLFSCGNKRARPAFYDSGIIESDSSTNNSFTRTEHVVDNDIIVVPFREEGGVKYVKVKINGCLSVEMIFDTGCSGTLISMAEAKYLYQRGYLTQNDYLGDSQSQIADGSIVENMAFNLKEVIIDDRINCPNVTATVSANINAPLLLGNEVLNRVVSYTIDNKQKTINFKLK
jgi:hypothetical protein